MIKLSALFVIMTYNKKNLKPQHNSARQAVREAMYGVAGVDISGDIAGRLRAGVAMVPLALATGACSGF
ncbi:MAG: hypothetical protein LBH31_08580 [Burkholderiaceae bacterium]|nr:hypothetical protein [Burkholderiaceae bacterium]